MIATAGREAADAELVAAVRAGDDSAFEELYRRYQPRIARFVRGMLHDAARCEDVAQEAFLSALRGMRAKDAEINFKPWIYQIARNAAIDSYRRNNHTVEVSIDAGDGLRASDRTRLVGADVSPDAALVTKERLDHLQGAFDELSDVHTRVLVMRELEGMSYHEIGQQLDLTRPAVESALFRARRRLESEYEELSEGRRCEAMRGTMSRILAGTQHGAEEHRLARHAKRCHSCRKRARELGIEPRARIVASSVSGVEPEIMGVGPIEAVRRVLARAGMTIDDVDVVELNEAFAAQVLPVCREIGVDPFTDKLNPHGGAIALGHPYGMTGARIMNTLLNDLDTMDRTIGLETMCVGGGQGMAMLIERI